MEKLVYRGEEGVKRSEEKMKNKLICPMPLLIKRD